MRVSETTNLLGRPVLAPTEIAWTYPSFGFLLLKRLIDILLSIVVCIFILSWLLPILAIMIKIDSRGPVFFIQRRVGLYGNKFGCIKLRTMRINPDADRLQATINDPRITRIGKFLRLSCFDELPQFINVLKGDMSIVGPRPHMINDCREFAKVVPTYHFRHAVKPGITGLAQVRGLRGKTNSTRDIVLRFQWDYFYVRNASIKTDLMVMIKTFNQIAFAVLKGKSGVKKKEAAIRQLPATNTIIYANEIRSDIQSTTGADRLTSNVGAQF